MMLMNAHFSKIAKMCARDRGYVNEPAIRGLPWVRWPVGELRVTRSEEGIWLEGTQRR